MKGLPRNVSDRMYQVEQYLFQQNFTSFPNCIDDTYWFEIPSGKPRIPHCQLHSSQIRLRTSEELLLLYEASWEYH
jgi:hypothetical protein